MHVEWIVLLSWRVDRFPQDRKSQRSDRRIEKQHSGTNLVGCHANDSTFTLHFFANTFLKLPARALGQAHYSFDVYHRSLLTVFVGFLVGLRAYDGAPHTPSPQ